MALRPPSDAVVTLRSLPRRFRGLFAGHADDEAPDALAQRPGADGSTALGHLVAAIQGVAATGRALDASQHAEDPSVDPVVLPAAAASGTVEERLAELGWETDAVADRVDAVDAEGWSRQARLAGTSGPVSALDVLWAGIDAVLAHLKAAERAIDEARRAR